MPSTPETQFEHPNCAVCGGSDRDTVFSFNEPYTVVRCRACEMCYLYPRLTESAMLNSYASDLYFKGGEAGYSDTGYSEQERALRSTFARLMENLKKRSLTGGSLLEIGCGYGYLLGEAERYFERRVGTEFSAEGVRLAAGNADAVFHGGIEKISSDVRFDCVLATHVIEHVYDPLDFIRKLVARTTDKGAVVLAAPDMGGMLRKLFGRRWPSFKMPEHIHYFDSRSLGRLMEDAGLRDIQTLPYPHAFPLSLIASKFGLPLPTALACINIWVPATTIALYGRTPNEDF